MNLIGALQQAHRRWLPRQNTLIFGAAIILLWLLLAILAPWIAPFDPTKLDQTASLLPPGAGHLFGTDNFGRDILSRVLWGARVDLQICLIGVIFPLCWEPRWAHFPAISAAQLMPY